MAEFLLSRGARLDLHSAAALGMVDEVEAMLRQDPSLVHQRLNANNEAMQPLHLAAWWGHTETARCLLTHGADPTATDGAGKTPADRAEERGHTDVAALLRQHAGPQGPSSRQPGGPAKGARRKRE